jgi:hypothetical protein
MGIGSTAFAKLLGQQSANATMNVALGKLPWGFTANAGTAAQLRAWEAIVWGDSTYCSFVLVAPNDATWMGVAGFIKAVFRWQASPGQTMQVSGIEASAPYDATLSTAIYTYTGMMDAGAKFRANTITAKNMIAGEVAFVSATTNNQSVMVDFASWVTDSLNNGLVLGHVQSSPNMRAESVYYAVDNGDGTVSVRIAAAGSGATSVVDSYDEINTAWAAFQKNNPPSPKPAPVRCGGALYLNYYYGEPIPAGKCDDSLSWANASASTGSRTWETVPGSTAPMNKYMLLPLNSTTPLMRGHTADDLTPVISETYVHTWDAASAPASGFTIIDNATQGTGLNQISYTTGSIGWNQSTVCFESYNTTSASSVATNATATMAFNGTQVHLYGNTHPNHGIAAVSIDNGDEVMVDFWGTTRRGYQLVWSSPNLIAGNHTIKVRVTGTHNAVAGGVYVVIDAIAVTNDAAACKPESNGSFCARLGKDCGSVTDFDNCGATRTVAFCGSCQSPLTCGGSGFANVCGNGAIVDDSVTGTAANQFNYPRAPTGSHELRRLRQLLQQHPVDRRHQRPDGHPRLHRRADQALRHQGPGQRQGRGEDRLRHRDQIDFYNASQIGDQLMWTSSMLTAGSHTMTLRVLGTKNASSTGYTIMPDRVAILASAACTAESDATFCARLAKNCGAVTGADNCGTSRTVASCGTCGSGETCGYGVCTASGNNLFTNASFAGGTSGWITYIYPGAGSFGTDATGQDGSGSARFSIPSSYGGTTDWYAHAYQTQVADGGAYTMSVYFQKAEGTSKKLTLFCEQEGGAYTEYGHQECTNTSGWTQCSVTCTPPAGVLTKFGVSAAWDNVDVRIDNMSLVSGTPPPSCTPESDTAFCSRLAKNCGSVTGTDNCGPAAPSARAARAPRPDLRRRRHTPTFAAAPRRPTSSPTTTFASGTTGWTTYFASGCAGSLAADTNAHDGDKQ